MGWSNGIERAAYAQTAAVEHVGVDHRGFDIAMAEKLLDGADVVAILQQMGGEAVAESVTGDAFGEGGQVRGLVDGALEPGGTKVVTADVTRARIGRQARGGESELPDPIAAGRGEFAVEGVGEEDKPLAGLHIAMVEALNVVQVVEQVRGEGVWKHADAVAGALTLADEDLVLGEVEILDPQAEAFHQSQAAAVEQASHKLVGAGEAAQDFVDFQACEDGGEGFGAVGAHELSGEVEFEVEDGAVEEEQSAERLVLGGGRDVVVDGEGGEERFDVVRGEEGRVSLFVEEDEAADPMQVGGFGAWGVVAQAEGGAGVVEQLLGHERPMRWR
jgi:hypothetical protein